MSKITITNTFPFDKWKAMDVFLTEAYSASYILRDRQLFKWMLGTPDDKSANVICAWDGDKITAILGYIVTEMFWGDTSKTILGSWSVNWMTLESSRNGTGWVLFRKWKEMFDVSIAYGGNDATNQFAKNMGFSFHESVPRYLTVFDSKKIRNFMHDPIATIPMYIPPSTLSTPQILKSEKQFCPNWELYPSLKYGTIRNIDYIKHKYLSGHGFKYKLTCIGPPGSIALCVYRIETTTGNATEKIGRIVEFFYPQTPEGETNGEQLLKWTLKDLYDNGCVFADILCGLVEYKNILINSGLHMETEQTIAYRLNPIEPANTRRPCVAINVAKGLTQPLLSEIYITKADSDQDRAR